MIEDLNIALIQTHLFWENPMANRHNFEEKIAQLKEDTQLVVLPEMFTTGFTMNPGKVSEKMDGETVLWMQQIASKKDIAIVGSIVVQEDNEFFNRAVFVLPDGEVFHYDKRHTFTLAGEHKVYTSGNKKIIVDYKGWKICPLICYDLRFPVWARNVENYDLLIYMANWPKQRINAWDILLNARAIENMCFVAGVNRIGVDEKGYEYPGHSKVFNVLGEEIAFSNKEEVVYATLKKSEIKRYRDKLKFLNDKDSFILK